jgi:hypothetical protein
MNYIVNARSVRLTGGVLVLTNEQAAPRAHNLKKLNNNRYEIIHAVEFKQNEKIGYEGDLPKSMADVLVDPATATKAKKAAEAAAKAAAAAAEKAKAEADQLAAEKAAKVSADKEEKAKAIWDADKDLRAHHKDDFEAYLADVMAG